MLFDPSTRASYLAWQFSQAVVLRLERALRPHGLSLAQHNALVQVALSPGISSAEIARRAGMTAQSMGTAVNSLVERGLVRRGPHPTNRRIVQLLPTPPGLELAATSQASLEASNEEVLCSLGDDERAALTATLRRLVEQTNPAALYLRDSDGDDDRPPPTRNPVGDKKV